VIAMTVFLALAGITMAVSEPKARERRNQNFDEKMRRFMNVKDDVQVVAFGSSHIENAVDPSSMDSSSVFNFGLPNVRGFELESTIRAVLETAPESMEVALIEISRWPAGVEPWQQHYAPAWQNPEHFIPALTWSLRHGEGITKKVSTMSAFVRRYVPIGSARDNRWVYHIEDEYLESRSTGYRPPSDNFDEGFEPRRNMLEARGGSVPMVIEPDSRVSLTGLRRIKRLCESYGVRAVFIRPPNSRRYGEESTHDYAGLDVLWFDDPGEYPELFLKANRWDSIHLNDDGAHRFSEILNEELINVVKPRTLANSLGPH
jgi:hypothetical protein